MKNLLVLVFSSLAVSGFSFIANPATEKKQSASVVSSSPVQEMFGYIRTHRQGKGVSVNWGVTTGTGITGFTVERSYDREFFDVINQVQSTSSLKYSWKDDSVFPGIIYYRIGCITNDGRLVYSAVDIVRIVSHG